MATASQRSISTSLCKARQTSPCLFRGFFDTLNLGKQLNTKMRTTQLSGNEILAAEQAADDRRLHRNSGYSLMKDRDRGYARLQTYYNSPRDVVMKWGVDDSQLFELQVRANGKTINIVLDAEEFRKHLRWV